MNGNYNFKGDRAHETHSHQTGFAQSVASIDINLGKLWNCIQALN